MDEIQLVGPNKKIVYNGLVNKRLKRPGNIPSRDGIDVKLGILPWANAYNIEILILLLFKNISLNFNIIIIIIIYNLVFLFQDE